MPLSSSQAETSTRNTRWRIDSEVYETELEPLLGPFWFELLVQSPDNVVHMSTPYIPVIMSQSDLTARKRVRAQLAFQSKLPAVLPSQMYTSFVQFTSATEPTNLDAKPTTFNDLTYPGQYKVFDVPATPDSECDPFEVCAGTDARPNRRPTSRPLFALGLSLLLASGTKEEKERTKDKKEQEEREERRRRSETRKSQQIHSGKYCCLVSEPQ